MGQQSTVSVLRGDADIAAIGALVADPARCRILLALNDGRALPASRLAAEAGVSPATASSHLGKLTEGGLLAVQAHGRHRYYRLAGPEVARLIEALQQLAPEVPIRSLRQSTRAKALREARTCYDHLAGRLGVEIMATMIEQGHLTGGDGAYDPSLAQQDRPNGYGHDAGYVLTEAGQGFLAGFGVRIPPRRTVVRYCVDWSEQRHHLAGALGRGLLDRLTETGWIRRAEVARVVHVTDLGCEGLRDTFGIVLAR
ncbi:transcriptional regulator [Acrocarpospora phusangensis]|uniref:Transcriptional regulator n=1 Tax=Acrocarpospora phusangensis TaxID=1070424 RepID=A0A919UPL5_9ACTN|nr:winged helix-turn-helix domain-containing protein [Acrocarpospora phusangensis]GIH25817.1 transcriptional regulator [Acrocarpospora phusangensis]